MLVQNNFTGAQERQRTRWILDEVDVQAGIASDLVSYNDSAMRFTWLGAVIPRYRFFRTASK